MSPRLQRRHQSRQPDPSPTTHPSSPTHTPQQWFRPASNPPAPNLARSHHPNRALGFSSIKQLAKSSRQALSILPTNTTQPPPIHRLRSQSSLYGTLRDQCTPPAPEPEAETPKSPSLGLDHSHDSSIDSFSPDQSGTSIDSSHPTTPSPARHKSFYELDTTPSFKPKNMGQNASAIVRTPLSIKAKQSLVTIRGDRAQREEGDDASPMSSPQSSSATKAPPFKSSLKVQVPRRRSSLTAIHLDSSHFDTLDPKQPNLQHRASTLTEPGRRPSGLAESIRPVISNTSTIMVSPLAKETISPPLLSPPISSTRASSASLTSPSDNPRSSPVPSHIHLPETFPKGPVAVPAPPLTIVHLQCYQGHKKMYPSGNRYNPVPCMVCKQEHAAKRWRCPFCALRICESCMAEFDRHGRNLEMVVGWMDRLKEEDEKAAGWIDKKRSLEKKKENHDDCNREDDGGKPSEKPMAVKIKKIRDTL